MTSTRSEQVMDALRVPRRLAPEGARIGHRVLPAEDLDDAEDDRDRPLSCSFCFA